MPFCVLLAWAMGVPMDLNFNTFEASAYFLAVLLAVVTIMDGTSNWLKGAVLVVTYLLLAGGFWCHRDKDLTDQDIGGV